MPSWIVELIMFSGLLFGIYTFFCNLEERIIESKRKKMGMLLKRYRGKRYFSIRRWTTYFIEMFDSVFSPRGASFDRFNIPYFWRSVGFSILFVFFLAAIMSVAQGKKIIHIDENTLSIFLLLFFFLNLIPDYISIVQTRYVLHRMKKSRCPIAWFITDIILTGLLPFVSIYLLLEIYGSHTDLFNKRDVDVSFYVNILLFKDENLSFLNIFIFSTFLTSLWMWLYALGSFLTIVAQRVTGQQNFLYKIHDLERNPLSLIGLHLIIFFFLIYIVSWAIAGILG